jgi:hypothetical protein
MCGKNTKRGGLSASQSDVSFEQALNEADWHCPTLCKRREPQM